MIVRLGVELDESKRANSTKTNTYNIRLVNTDICPGFNCTSHVQDRIESTYDFVGSSAREVCAKSQVSAEANSQIFGPRNRKCANFTDIAENITVTVLPAFRSIVLSFDSPPKLELVILPIVRSAIFVWVCVREGVRWFVSGAGYEILIRHVVSFWTRIVFRHRRIKLWFFFFFK